MHRLALAGVAAVLVTAAAGAQNPTILTETEFLAVLDRNHPAVAASAEELAVARARVVEESTLANPVTGVVREDPSGPVAQTDWTVSWQLPHADRRPRVAAHREAAAAAGHRLAQRLRRLRLEMRRVYADWALATARRDRLAAQAERVESLARREAERAERGEASGLEAQRLRLAATDLRSRVALTEAALARARAGAASWYPALPVDARPRLPELPPPPGDEAGDDDDNAHPRVRAAEAELAAALLEQRAADRFVASPELSLGWQRQEMGPESVDGPLLGVAWSVPLFDRNQGRRAAAEARIDGARGRLDRARREVRAGLQAAAAAYRRLAAARSDAADALTTGERMLDGAEAAFLHGETGLTDLLETHRAVTDGELTLLDLHGAALAAHRDLERWTRGDDDLPDDLFLSTPKEPTR